MKIKSFDWKDHFYPVYMSYIQDGDSLPINKSFWKYHRQIEYLKIIWARIKRDYPRHLKAYRKFTEEELQGGTVFLDNKTLKQMELSKNSLKIYNLDVDSFFVFSGVLMDTISELADHLLGKMKLGYTFSGQIKKFNSNSNPTANDKLYKKYKNLVLKNAYWFTTLKTTRDKVIIHPKGFTDGTKYSQGGEITLMRFDLDKAWTKNEDAGELFKKKQAKLFNLKNKYKKKYTFIENEENFWELIRLFFENDIEMKKEDKEALMAIIETYGTEISIRYLESIADRINVLIQDFADIFKTKAI